MEASELFVSTPTVDDPHKRVSLQDLVLLLIAEIQDLKARQGELERSAQLCDELATAVRKMQTTFTSLAQQLSGTNAVAKSLMAGRAPNREVN